MGVKKRPDEFWFSSLLFQLEEFGGIGPDQFVQMRQRTQTTLSTLWPVTQAVPLLEHVAVAFLSFPCL